MEGGPAGRDGGSVELEGARSEPARRSWPSACSPAAATGCGSGQVAGSMGTTRLTRAITPSNVSTLAPLFSASDGSTGAVTPQAVVNGILYVADVNGLEAYSAAGTTGCSGSPTLCPAVELSGSVGSRLRRRGGGQRRASIVTRASGSRPSTPPGRRTVGHADDVQPVVARHRWPRPSAPDGGQRKGIRRPLGHAGRHSTARGSRIAPGVPRFARRSGAANDVRRRGRFRRLRLRRGRCHGERNGGGLGAFDANGIKGCSGTPKVCTHLWGYTSTRTITSTDASNLEGPLPWGYPVVSRVDHVYSTVRPVGAYSREIWRPSTPMARRMRRTPRPVLAAVDGEGGSLHSPSWPAAVPTSWQSRAHRDTAVNMSTGHGEFTPALRSTAPRSADRRLRRLRARLQQGQRVSTWRKLRMLRKCPRDLHTLVVHAGNRAIVANGIGLRQHHEPSASRRSSPTACRHKS